MYYVKEIQISYKATKKKINNVESSLEASQFFQSILPSNSKESFMALYLNTANVPLSFSIVSTGLVDRCMVHPREVFQPAIACGAATVIVAHNHPSDQLKPSPQDIEITAKLREVGNLIGIPVMDHLIITDFGYYSFLEYGIL